MAKVKNPLIESKQPEPIIFSDRKDKKDGFTHDAKIKELKIKKRK